MHVQEDDVPLNKRVKIVVEPVQRKKNKQASADAKAKLQKSKKRKSSEKPEEKSRPKRQKTEAASDKKAEKKWDTLHHSGVLFPPDYKPHGIRMLYEGRPVELTPEQEEVNLHIGIHSPAFLPRKSNCRGCTEACEASLPSTLE